MKKIVKWKLIVNFPVGVVIIAQLVWTLHKFVMVFLTVLIAVMKVSDAGKIFAIRKTMNARIFAGIHPPEFSVIVRKIPTLPAILALKIILVVSGVLVPNSAKV